jgi:hypothetical protein
MIDVDQCSGFLEPFAQASKAVGTGAVNRQRDIGWTETRRPHENLSPGKEVVLSGKRNRVVVPAHLQRDPTVFQCKAESEDRAERVAVRRQMTGDRDRVGTVDGLDGTLERGLDVGRYRRQVGSRMRGFGAMDLLEDRIDPLRAYGCVVQVELELGQGLHADTPSGLGAQEGSGALEPRLCSGTLQLVAEHRVVHMRFREIRRHAHGCDRHETDAGVLDVPLY